MKKKNIIFDFDGTLIDTNQLIINSWQSVFQYYEGKERPEEEILKLFGETINFSMKKLFPDIETEETVSRYREYQKQHIMDFTRLFDGVETLLEDLKTGGYRMAIVTSRFEKTTRMYLKNYNIAHYFEFLISCDMVQSPKPDPEPLLMALDKMGAEKQDSIMIGDTKFDIACANNTGVDSVLVNWGVGIDPQIKGDKYKPSYRIDKPGDLLKLV